jgi:putative transposase
VNGRKRHIVTDTLGLIVRVKVHRADLQDREAVPLLLEGMNEQFPRVSHAWVDQGYTGIGKQWIEEQLKWTVEVVRHPPRPRGMWVLPGQEIDMTLFQRPKGFRGVLPRTLWSSNALLLGCPFVADYARIMSFCLKAVKIGSIRL